MYIHTRIRVYVCIRTIEQKHTFMCTCVYVCMHIHTYTHTHKLKYTHIRANMLVFEQNDRIWGGYD